MSADASDALTDAIGRTRAVPIGDYGFLSDGEVSALLAPGGSVSWMCVPRFDSPSVFGSILGRHAGTFRIAPLDVGVPAARRYLPGTMILETSWGTPTGWIIVRDVLLIGPWHHERRPLADLPAHAQRLRGRAHPAAHHPLRLRRGADGHGLRAGVRLRPVAGRLGVHRRELPPGHAPPPTGCDVRPDADHRHAARLRGRPGQRAHAAQGGRHPLRRAVVGRRRAADDVRRRLRAAGLDRAPLAALAGARPVPRPPVAQLPAAQRADAQGPDLRPDRRGHRRRQHVAARDARAATATTTTATPGSATRRSRCGGCTPSGFDWEAVDFFSFIADIAERRRRPADHVRHRRRARPRGVRARPPARLRQLPAGAHRQRGVRAEAARRLGRPARLGLPALQGRRPPRQPDLADPRQAGRRGAQALARARRRHLGGARRAEALHLVQDHVLGRRRPWREARPDERRGRQGRRVGAGGRRDQAGHPRQRRRRARRPHPVLRRHGARRVAAARAARCASCRPTTRASGPR